jgi:hypothetical protein
MSPRIVGIAGIGLEDMAKVSFAEHNNMIEAFPADGTDQPLRISVLPGRSRRGGAIANAHGLQLPTHGVTIGRVAVSDQVTRHFIPWEGVSNLSGDPRRCRMIGNADRNNVPPVMPQNHQRSRKPMVGTTRKSIAAIPAAWLRRKVLQV